MDIKIQEQKARRAAQRQGLRLVKSRRRDPHAEDHGTYVFVEDKAGSRKGGGQAAKSAFDRGGGLRLHEVLVALFGHDIDVRVNDYVNVAIENYRSLLEWHDGWPDPERGRWTLYTADENDDPHVMFGGLGDLDDVLKEAHEHLDRHYGVDPV
ncbi:hypothetical protein CLV49_3286 [Labedella gwakjiensis]|uniref:Uncharacterized protein n=1 Tax=Labedella gwakjiensis TaxID=390269 RepID=A0A2P8H0B4_9MICO|nr:hypothetical protein [Labedella gwakjiensis]PSL39642.1 hypothetical protein CLV49_3286 [Labedella gwakjiensis]RUQ85968.1 hypothetical protein ELQ93_02825 [Labedella gwakjiensis]